MTRTEVTQASLLILTLVGGSFLSMISQKEIWPFSHYPMYSAPLANPNEFKLFEFYGIKLRPKAGEASEFLLNSTKSLTPYSDGKLNLLLGRAKVMDHGKTHGAYKVLAGTPEFMERKLTGLIVLYESNRNSIVSNASNFPEIAGIRMYEMTYSLNLPGNPLLSKILLHETLQSKKAE